ncbi:hypothetical protein QBC43DRAFT_51314 [Cladorrhinum sp. PSN259]|nr:hypothetical protein QBC43DRAFT_51314 [Cladorrhinum sp. PSN259]
MAPLQPYRTATTTRRGARGGFPEQDDFEGLPVRQWRKQWVSVAMTPPNDTNEEGDIWAEDPSHGMPKESHLLAPHIQELLRAARSINFGKRPAPDDDEEDLDNYGVDKKEEEEENEGFMIQTWKQLPRTAETPSQSHLAKRHKNTVTLSSKPGLPHVTGPTITRATVRRIDAAGNPYEQTITLAEGQKVDGEIISTTVVPAPVPKVQDAELATQQPTPNKRRPPPPKRKPKGPGRGRKKKLPLPLPLPATRSQQQAAEGDGSAEVKTEGESEDMSKLDDNEDSTMQDSEMADNSALQSEDEEDGGDDDGDQDNATDGPDAGADEATPEIAEQSSSNEVVELVQDQDHDQEMLDSDATEILHPSSVEEPDDVVSPAGAGARRGSSGEEELTIPKPRFQAPVGLGPFGSFGSPRMEGSPLKNVMTHSPTEGGSPSVGSPSAGAAATSAAAAESFTSSAMPMDIDTGDVGASETVVTEAIKSEETEHPEMPPVAEAPLATEDTVVEELVYTASAVFVTEDTVIADADASAGAAESVETGIVPPASVLVPDIQVQELDLAASPSEPLADFPAASAKQEEEEEGKDDDDEDEDDGPNLLGSLEAELDRQESLSNAAGSRADTPKQQQQQQQQQVSATTTTTVTEVVLSSDAADIVDPVAVAVAVADVSVPVEEEKKQEDEEEEEAGVGAGVPEVEVKQEKSDDDAVVKEEKGESEGVDEGGGNGEGAARSLSSMS